MGDEVVVPTPPRCEEMVMEARNCSIPSEKQSEVADAPPADNEQQNAPIEFQGSLYCALHYLKTGLSRLPRVGQSCNVRTRSSVRFYLAVLTFVALVTLIHLIRLTDLAAALPPIDSSFQADAIPDADAQPRILILQHFSPHSSPRFPMPEGLTESSRISHERYADLWQYDYRADERQLVLPVREGEDVVAETATQSFNKLYAVMLVVMDEMDKPVQERAEWIMATDADSIIFNPLVPLHLLLPPQQAVFAPLQIVSAQPNGSERPPPAPLILAAQDFNGFNAGVMMFHLAPDDPDLLLGVLGEVLAHRALAFDEEGMWHSDQACWGRVLRAHPEVAERFWEVPQIWWNAYYPDLSEGAKSVVEQRDEAHGEWRGENDPDWTPTVQIHLPGGYKYSEPWRDVFAFSQRVHEDLEQQASASNTTAGEVARSMGTYRRTEDVARAFWKRATSGIDNMAWNDY